MYQANNPRGPSSSQQAQHNSAHHMPRDHASNMHSLNPKDGCKICKIPNFRVANNMKGHMHSYNHCQNYLLQQLMLGFGKFNKLYGHIPFGLKMPDEIAMRSENQVDPNDALDLHLYRAAMVNKFKCMMCEVQIINGLAGWKSHVKGVEHAKNYVKQMEKIQTVAKFRESYGCLTIPPPDKIMDATKVVWLRLPQARHRGRKTLHL